MSEPAIRMEGLVKTYGRIRAVDDLTLRVGAGEIFGFLGPNGAGKSTTIRMLLGLIRPTAGSAAILGLDVIRNRREALRHVGAIIEAPAFYPGLAARTNLELHLRMHGLEDDGRVDRVLGLVRLKGREGEPVQAYSHGMRQRLGIARAILHDPQVVILDEPSDGLDPRGRREVRDIIQDICRRLGKTVLLSSHLLEEMEQMCDRVAILNRGKLIYEGGVEEVRSRQRVLVVSVDRVEEAARLLAAMDGVGEAVVSGGRLRVSLREGAEPESVSRSLVEAGFALREMRAHRESLEDVFLDLTQ